jgi:hypothetical protein
MIHTFRYSIIPHFTIRVNSFCLPSCCRLPPWNIPPLFLLGYLTDEEPVLQDHLRSLVVSVFSLPSRQDAFPAKGFEHEVEHQGIEGREASDAQEEGCHVVADFAGYLGYGQGHDG